MQNWEYLALNRFGGKWSDDQFDGRGPTDKLTEFGAEGWELVTVSYDGSAYHFYLKRPLPKKPTRKTSGKMAKSK